MNFPPKAISVLILVQCLFIGMGYALTRKMARLLQQSELPAFVLNELSGCSEFVLRSGPWALLIPLLCTAWGCLRSESHRGIPLTQSVDARIAIGLTAVIICIWSYAAMQAIDAAFTLRRITVVNLNHAG